jgi:iron complex transport system ATP-binding protein
MPENKKKLQLIQVSIRIGQKKICSALNLTFNPGEVWGLLGQNGAGKTTILHSLAGVHPIDEGEILFARKNIQKMNRKQVAQNIGLLLQEEILTFPVSVLQNLQFGLYPHSNKLTNRKKATANQPQSIPEILKIMHLTELENKNIFTLSGGEKQRVSIARLLVQNPNIYLLDEPINHLDPYYQLFILQFFYRLARNHNNTVIMALHDINFINHFCDRVLMLFADGEVVHGDKRGILTAENLRRIFNYPIREISGKNSNWFTPLPENFSQTQ